jgi:hypothetical protein
MLDVMNAFVGWRNGGVRANLRRPVALRYDDSAAGVRLWALHVWEVSGPPASWGAQLADRLREQPVFAVLGGQAAGSWAPVEAFCERQAIPCLFPLTDLPGPAAPVGFTLHLSAGMAGEAAAIAEAIATLPAPPATRQRRVVQVRRDEERSNVAAAALRRALRDTPAVRLVDHVLPAGELARRSWRTVLAVPAEVLVLWLDEHDLAVLAATPSDGERRERVFLSTTLAGDAPALPPSWRAVARIATPYAPRERPVPHRHATLAWLRSRGVTPGHERIQLSTHFTLSLADHALMHLGRDLSREAFLEALERETEREPNPGPFAHLSLGPGQRVAARHTIALPVADPP